MCQVLTLGVIMASSPVAPQQLSLHPTFTVGLSRFLPLKVTSVSWFMGMTNGVGLKNWGQLSSWGSKEGQTLLGCGCAEGPPPPLWASPCGLG